MEIVIAILQLLPTIIPLIIKLMQELEVIFKDQQNCGYVKKQICMDTVKAQINNDEVWPHIQNFVGANINLAAKLQFNSSGKDPIPSSNSDSKES